MTDHASLAEKFLARVETGEVSGGNAVNLVLAVAQIHATLAVLDELKTIKRGGSNGW